MFATGETVVLAEWIIDDTYLVHYYNWCHNHRKVLLSYLTVNFMICNYILRMRRLIFKFLICRASKVKKRYSTRQIQRTDQQRLAVPTAQNLQGRDVNVANLKQTNLPFQVCFTNFATGEKVIVWRIKSVNFEQIRSYFENIAWVKQYSTSLLS